MSSESSKKDRRAEHMERRRAQGLTLAEMGEDFGGVHRTTISRRMKRAKEACESDD